MMQVKNVIIIICLVLFNIIFLSCCVRSDNNKLCNYGKNLFININIPNEWITKTSGFKNNRLLLQSTLSYDKTNFIEIYKNKDNSYSFEGLSEIIRNFDIDKLRMDNKRRELTEQYNKHNLSKSVIIPSILISIDDIVGIQDGLIFTDKNTNITCYTINIDIPFKGNIYNIFMIANSPESLLKEFEIIKTIKFVNI